VWAVVICVDDNDKYSPVLDVSSIVRNVVSLLVFEKAFIVVEIN